MYGVSGEEIHRGEELRRSVPVCIQMDGALRCVE